MKTTQPERTTKGSRRKNYERELHQIIGIKATQAQIKAAREMGAMLASGDVYWDQAIGYVRRAK